MPFDGTRTEKSEIDILDEMLITLSSPESWTKGKAYRFKKTGFFFPTYTKSYCLMGALCLADNGEACSVLTTVTAKNVQYALSKALNNRLIVKFNDSHSTTHKDILALLNKVRNEFVAKLMITV